MRPLMIGMEDTEPHTVERELLSAGADMPRNCLTRQLVEEGVIQRVCHLFARLDHNPGPIPLQDTEHAAQVIGVGMGNEHQRQFTYTMTGKERHHHTPPSIALIRLWPAVDQHPAT